MSTQSISDPRTNPTLPADGATATPLENMVSWQSVFFGLAALALNAMTQRSYFDAVFPHSSILFAMRSSPFVCIADLIEVIFVAGHHFMTKQRLQGLPLSSSTDQLPNVGNFAIEGEASFEASSTVGRGHPWVILILFVGTSTQAVKIFGFEGILWAKLWAAAYLLSYVSVALLDILLQPSKRREPIIGRYLLRRSAILNLRIALHIITLAVNMIFFCWAAYRLVHLDLYILQQHPNPVGFWGYLIRSPIIGASAIGALLIFSPLWTLILPLGWAFFRLFRVLEDLQHEREVVGSQSSCGQMWFTTRVWLCHVGIILSILVGMAIWMCSVTFYADFRLHAANVVVQGLILTLFFGIPCLIFVHYLTSRAFHPPTTAPLVSPRAFGSWNQALLVTFAVLNFGITILYYSIRYDPQGTVKPAWTEMLG